MVSSASNASHRKKPENKGAISATGTKSTSTTFGPEFVCRVKLQNNLPDIKVDPKMMRHDNTIHAKKLVPWRLTDLEKEYPYHVYDENILASIPIDLLNMEKYEATNLHSDRLADEDQELLDMATKIPGLADALLGSKKTSKSIRPEVSWLRRTEYISSEFNKSRSKTNRKSNISSSGGDLENIDDDELCLESLDRSEQIRLIQKSFIRKPLAELKHPKKGPGVHAVESYDILPHFRVWDQFLSTCLFDDDPCHKPSKPVTLMSSEEKSLYESLSETRLSQTDSSILHGYSNSENPSEKYLMYFLPKEDVVSAGADDLFAADAMVHARDYNFTLTPEHSSNYIFVLDQEKGVFRYVPLHSKIVLRKRRSAAPSTNVQEGDPDVPASFSASKPNLYRLERRDDTIEEITLHKTVIEDLLT